jgi:hypothetical protein
MFVDMSVERYVCRGDVEPFKALGFDSCFGCGVNVSGG